MAAVAPFSEPKGHVAHDHCPWCDQLIPHDRADEIHARIEARERAHAAEHERRVRTEVEARANAEKELLRQSLTREFATRESAVREEATKAAEARVSEILAGAEREKAAMADRVAVVEREKCDVGKQLELANANAAAREAAARQEATKAVETAMAEKVAIAEREKGEMKAKLDMATANFAAREAAVRQEATKAVETVMAEKVAAVEREKGEMKVKLETATANFAVREAAVRQEAAKAVEAAMADKVAAVEREKIEMKQALEESAAREAALRAQSTDRLAAVEAERDAMKQALESTQATQAAELTFQRLALEKAKDEEVAREKAKSFEEKSKLEGQLQHLTRQLQEQTAKELGEGAELNLYEDLKAEFPDDDIERIEKGVAGADIRHRVLHNDKVCGTILYDSKNRGAWKNEYVTKLKEDQLADKADHAVLATRAFPAGTKQLHVQEGVILANPARVVALVHLIRRHVVQTHTLRLSTEAKAQKKEALYGFFTSDRSNAIFERMTDINDKLQRIEEAEVKAHAKVWKDRGTLLKAAERTQARLVTEIEQIIGTAELDDESV
jgi:hypothetical protein